MPSISPVLSRFQPAVSRQEYAPAKYTPRFSGSDEPPTSSAKEAAPADEPQQLTPEQEAAVKELGDKLAEGLDSALASKVKLSPSVRGRLESLTAETGLSQTDLLYIASGLHEPLNYFDFFTSKKGEARRLAFVSASVMEQLRKSGKYEGASDYFEQVLDPGKEEAWLAANATVVSAGRRSPMEWMKDRLAPGTSVAFKDKASKDPAQFFYFAMLTTIFLWLPMLYQHNKIRSHDQQRILKGLDVLSQFVQAKKANPAAGLTLVQVVVNNAYGEDFQPTGQKSIYLQPVELKPLKPAE